MGFADILAVGHCGPLLIQATSNNGGNHAARVRKVKASAHAVRTCLNAGMLVEVWSWSDVDEPRIEAVTLADLPIECL